MFVVAPALLRLRARLSVGSRYVNANQTRATYVSPSVGRSRCYGVLREQAGWQAGAARRDAQMLQPLELMRNVAEFTRLVTATTSPLPRDGRATRLCVQDGDMRGAKARHYALRERGVIVRAGRGKCAPANAKQRKRQVYGERMRRAIAYALSPPRRATARAA